MLDRIIAKDVTVCFGGLKAVDHVSFSTEPGKILSIIGPNGAGKTTLFNTITGFITPTSGQVSFGDVQITNMKPYDIAKLGIIRTFQKQSFFPSISVRDNLLIGFHLATEEKVGTILFSPAWKKKEKLLHDKVKSLLEYISLDKKEDVLAKELPYGEQRRLGIAIALASNPKVLLLDEPCAGSNPTEVMILAELIRKICDTGTSIILVEHHMRVVMGLSDHVIVMNQGSKLAEGKPEDVSTNEEVVEAYLGK